MKFIKLARVVLAFASNPWVTAAARPVLSKGNLRFDGEPSLGATATDATGVMGICLWGCANGQYLGNFLDRRCTCDDDSWEGDCCDTYAGECTEGMAELCDASNLEAHSFSTNDLLDDQGNYQGPLTLATAAHGLPINMQGIFWLQDQSGSSSIISMAPSRDGKGLSVWNANSKRHISIRVGGDKVWSFASKGAPWNIAEGVDLVYHFEGTPVENPTHFSVIPEAQRHNLEMSGNFLEWAVNVEMIYIESGSAEHDYPAVGDRPAAVMYGRPSKIIGIDLETKYYKVAQIINGEGKPTAAYDAWVEYNKGSEEWQDETIWYHSA